MTEEQKKLVKRLTRQNWRQSAIAQKLGVTPWRIAYWQAKFGLPTRIVMDEQEVLALHGRGWSVERIAKRFSRRTTAIAEILRRARSRKAKQLREENETGFRAAIRRRAGSVRELATQFGISSARAYSIAHETFGSAKFRRGPAKAENLPIVTAERPTSPLAEPDVYVSGLVAFLNRYSGGQLPEPKDDANVVAEFLRHTPDNARDYVAFGLMRALDVLRRQSVGIWVH